MARFFQLHPEVKNVAIVGWDDPWGKVFSQMWEVSVSTAGRQLSFAKQVPPDFNYDYRSDVTRLVAARPDAVLITYDADKILRLFGERSFKPVSLSTANALEVLRNGTLPWSAAEGMYFLDWPPRSDFVSRYRARFGVEPFIEAFNAYDAVWCVVEAFEKDRGNLREGLLKVTRQGLAGEIDFSRGFGANFADPVLMQVRDGKPQRVP
jgi:ABC-type branched-subunit amino acid transport system substrate-binding protein